MNNPVVKPDILLVALDYSDLSHLAVRQAVELARQRSVESVHFAHVAKSTDTSDTQREAQKFELQQWLSNALKQSAGLPPSVHVVAHLLHGTPADAIVQLASDLLVDLVVVGTHGRTGVSRMVLGSVAELVVRNCGCPVLVTRKTEHHSEIPRIEPPCPRCVEARVESAGKLLWCAQHQEKHGRRHTYYNPRADSWVTHRLTI